MMPIKPGNDDTIDFGAAADPVMARAAAAARSQYGPAWRWKQAQKMLPQAEPPVSRFDAHLRAAYDYARMASLDEEQARQQYPHLAAAEAIFRGGRQQELLKTLVLAGCERQEIAGRLDIEVTVLAWWERVFFDVRPTLGATGWIFAHVIRPEQEAGRGYWAARMKLALAAGPAAARAILDEAAGLPLDGAQRLAQQRLSLDLKFQQAADMSLLSDADANEYVRFYSQLRQREKRLELDQQKLAAFCRIASQKNTQALKRLESAERRAAARLEIARRRLAVQEAKAEARTQEIDLHHTAVLAERELALVRVAESPLAQLTWHSAQPASGVSPPAAAVRPVADEPSAPESFPTAWPAMKNPAGPDAARSRSATKPRRRSRGRKARPRVAELV